MLDFFRIGHYTDVENGTGVTVILPRTDAVAGCSVRGYSPATRETDLLGADKTVQKVNAIVLSGGSAFGLDACSGVVQYLHEQGIGYDTGHFKVPIVSGASIYDLEYKNFGYPDKEAGYKACLDARVDNFVSGDIGAAGGSTVSKVLGTEYAVKSRLGVATLSMNGVEIAVITAVNALGDIVKDGEIIAGARLENGEYVDSKRVFAMGSTEPKKSNTTIGCVITNARLTKEQCNILASLAHDGYATSISPSHTLFDGDAMFVMSSGEKAVSFNMLTAIIPDLTAQSIQSSVTDVRENTRHVSGMLFKMMQKILK